MRIKNLFFLAALAVSATATLTSCEDILGTWDRPTPAAVTPTASVAVTGITLDDEATVNVGGTVTLTATVSPDNASDKTITWSSSDESVATVADGVVTGVAAGTAIITATANDGSGVKATCTVTVKKIPGLLTGVFSISATQKVQFSQGNLQATYDGSAWTWAFAANQWDYIGDAAGNTKVTTTSPSFISENATVDLFGWVGASSTWTGVNQYGITSSTATNATDGYGNELEESLKSDWGTLAISNGGNTANSGWRTLTGGDSGEWKYLFDSRTTATTNMPAGTNSSAARYTKATVAGVNGVILFPDDYAHPAGITVTVSEAAYNTASKAYTTFTVDATNWSTMETAGCVFLPAAGYRNGTSVGTAGSCGYYRSSSPYGSSAVYAYSMVFNWGNLNPAGVDDDYRFYGISVRLVRPVE